LTVISAPAGYGKSTLASRWVAISGIPCAWLSLDEGDGDLRTFFRYVLAAIHSQFPEARLRSAALAEVDQFPSGSDLALHFSNDLEEMTERFILVLDDLHRVDGSEVTEFLTELLAYPSQVMHLVLLTRSDPPLHLARLVARGEVTEIGPGDLRFAKEEAAAFLGTLLGKEVDEAIVDVLEERLEGWAAGLRLTGLYLREHDDWEGRLRQLRGTSRHIADYLVEEVLARQGPEVGDLLMETSILGRFCSSLCQAVHAEDDQRDEGRRTLDRTLMERLVGANVFMVPLDSEGEWYRYHHLVEELLLARLRERRTADEVAALHERACEWFAQNGFLDDAIHHALAAGSTSAAVRLVLDHRHELMNSSAFRRIEAWLDQLPADACATDPLLCTTRVFIGIERGSDADVLSFTSRAEEALARMGPNARSRGVAESEIQVLRGFIEMASGNAEQGLALATRALASPDLPAEALLVRSMAVFVAAGCHQMSGDVDSAEAVIREALSSPSWPANLRARIHFYRAVLRYMDGNQLGAMVSCGECLELVRHLPFTHTRTFATYLLGASHYLRGEIAEAEAHLRRTREDLYAANASYAANAGFILACLDAARGRQEQAEQALGQARTFFQRNGPETALALADSFYVEFALRQGDVARAKELSDDLDFDIRPPLWFFYVPQLTPAKLLLARGSDRDLEEARSRLMDLDRDMATVNRKSVRLDTLALLALVHDRMGDDTRAMSALEAALSLAEGSGLVRSFVDLGEPMEALVGRWILGEPMHEHGNRVMQAFDAEAQARQAHTGAFGQPGSELSPRELEVCRLLASGLTKKAIAATLAISAETVKSHVRNLYGKLGVKNRVEALNEARRVGLLDPLGNADSETGGAGVTKPAHWRVRNPAGLRT